MQTSRSQSDGEKGLLLMNQTNSATMESPARNEIPSVNAPQSQGLGPNAKVRAWIDECVALLKPDRIVWCDGSKEERERFFEQGVREKIFVKLNQKKWPGCYYHRSNSNDVARTEHLTFICAPSQDLAGPTNYWMN